MNLQENKSIILGGKPFKIMVGGGHAAGSTGFWNQEKLALIGGDMLLQKITPKFAYSCSIRFSTRTVPDSRWEKRHRICAFWKEKNSCDCKSLKENIIFLLCK
ncbi:hypothetical protein XI25_00820 [Paenibacillus sp. DMB20]|nr:hypothetical protein XI25_00820 [Paenibacillus sp. DMB20]